MKYLVEIAIQAADQAEMEELRLALEALAAEDDSLVPEFDDSSGFAVIACTSESVALGLDARLAAATGRHFQMGSPGVVYAERLIAPAEVDYAHKRQLGGTAQFARVKLRFEPLEEGAGVVFENRVIAGAVPAEFIPAVEDGIAIARQNGLLAGYPVSDFRAILLDGAFHDTDSSALAFGIAARGAFRDLKRNGEVRLMEPAMNVEIAVPGELAAIVRSVMRARRAEEIVTMKAEADAQLLFEAPLVRLFGLEAELADRTQGAAGVRLRYAGLREVPRHPGGGDDTYLSDIGLRA